MTEKIEAEKIINPDVFWNTFKLKENEKAHWKIGPLSLWATRYYNEWKVGWEHSENINRQSLSSQIPFKGEIPTRQISIKRFGFKSTPEEIKLVPALANRPCVVRPEIPFEIPSKQEVILYVSTPLWIRMYIGRSKKLLDEIPIYRPNDTWVGPNTMEGELCYGLRTHAHLRLEDLKIQYHRAITGVSIKNNASDALYLERLNLPIPHFSLFQSENKLFFTESIRLEREHDGKRAELKLTDAPLKEAGVTKKVRGPRHHLSRNIFVKTMQSIFG